MGQFSNQILPVGLIFFVPYNLNYLNHTKNQMDNIKFKPLLALSMIIGSRCPDLEFFSLHYRAAR